MQTQMRAELDGLQLALPAIPGVVPARIRRRPSSSSVGRRPGPPARVRAQGDPPRAPLRPCEVESAPVAEVEPSVLNPEKLAAMGGDIRLNLGAGHVGPARLPERRRPAAGRHRRGGRRAGTFPSTRVRSPRSTRPTCSSTSRWRSSARVLLPYWVVAARAGGRFVAVVPDLETMIAEYSAGRFDFEELREVPTAARSTRATSTTTGSRRRRSRALLEECRADRRRACVAFGRRNGHVLRDGGGRQSARAPPPRDRRLAERVRLSTSAIPRRPLSRARRAA